MAEKTYRSLPGPWGIPVFGSSLHLVHHKEKVLAQWAEEHYGPIFRFRLGCRQAVVLHSYSSIKEAYIHKRTSFSGRMESEIINQTRNKKGLFFSTYSGEYWKKWRIFAKEHLNAVWKTSFDGIITETNHLKAFLENNTVNSINLLLPLQGAMMNGILQTCFSTRYDYDDDKGKELFQSIYDVFQCKQFNYLTFFPWLSYLPQYNRFLQEVGEKRKRLVDQIIALINIRRSEKTSALDLVTCHDQALENSTECEDIEAFAMLIQDMLFGGSTTTANQLLWVLLFLLKQPEYMKKVQNEIDQVCVEWPSKSELESNFNKLAFTRAAIHEACRLRPIAPLGLVRETSESTSVSGYQIPAGIAVLSNIWYVHHDPDIWSPDPESFRPERHIDQSGVFTKSEFVMNYSIGFRRCVGEKIADYEMLVHLITLLHHFDIRLAEESIDVSTDGISGAILKPHPFKVDVSIRDV